MYFAASEQLARDNGALGRVIEACDGLIYTMGADGVLSKSDVLARLSTYNAYQVETVMALFGAAGVLDLVQERTCAECGTANGPALHACTQCGSELAGIETEAVYIRTGEPERTSMTTAAPPPAQVDGHGKPVPAIGIITALEKEYAALCDVLDLTAEWLAPGVGAGRRYHYGTIMGANQRPHTVVATLLPATGTNTAAARATLMLNHFSNLSHVVMCGIAGGVPGDGGPEEDIRLGDVVVTDKGGVVQFDFGKDRNGEFEVTAPPRPPSAELIEAVRFLRAAELRTDTSSWAPHLQRASRLPWSRRPADNAGAKEGTTISYRENPARAPGQPAIAHGPIASSNSLVKNATRREDLRRAHKVKAIEMEGSGVADATWIHGHAGYLVVRGIVDLADDQKGDVWHGYASFAAAAVLRALLESMPA